MKVVKEAVARLRVWRARRRFYAISERPERRIR